MSSTATFHSVPLVDLENFVRTTRGANLWRFLGEHGRELVKFPWSGDFIATLFSFLQEEKGIDLVNCGIPLFDNSKECFFVLTPKQAEAFLPQLDEALYSEADLSRYFGEYTDEDEPEAGAAMLAGIRALKQALGEASDAQVSVINFG